MKDVVDAVLAETRGRDNPYFAALRDGSFDRDDFVETQIQFYYAVVFFSRPMAVIAAKIPSPALRIEVMRNVWEEHGEGDETQIHGHTFRLLLRRLAGVEIDDIEGRVLWPEVRAFNTALIGCAVADDWEVGTACFGMIERMFVDISSWIGQGILQRGWLSRDQIVHYNVHEKLDVKHSDDFFAVLDAGTDGSPKARYCIEQGLRLGAHVFDSLWEGLYRARARRMMSSVQRPQAHIYRT
jgi:hypothetical protein